jgi:hypothetical protein
MGANLSVIPDAAKRRSGIQMLMQTVPLDSGFASFARVPE